jgi:hypothetical protein
MASPLRLHNAPTPAEVSTQERCASLDDAHAAIDLAVRIHGRKRGFHVAAALLRRSERWVHGLHYHSEGAAPDFATAHAALMTLRRQRAASIRAELTDMENHDLADDLVARARAADGLCG